MLQNYISQNASECLALFLPGDALNTDGCGAAKGRMIQFREAILPIRIRFNDCSTLAAGQSTTLNHIDLYARIKNIYI